LSAASSRRRRASIVSPFSQLWRYAYSCMLPDYMVPVPVKVAEILIAANSLRTALRYASSGEAIAMIEPSEALRIAVQNVEATCRALRYPVCDKLVEEAKRSAERRSVRKAENPNPVGRRVALVEIEAGWEAVKDVYSDLVEYCTQFTHTRMVQCMTVVVSAFLALVAPPLPWEVVLEYVGEEE